MTTNTKQITLIAFFLSLSVVVPIFFHFIGAGKMFLPMFIPILLAGFLIDFPAAIFVGVLAPWVSAFATGMPPLFPTAVTMSIEGIVAAGLASYLYHVRKTNFWIALIAAVLAERIAAVFMVILLKDLILPLLGISAKMLSIAVIFMSYPGVLLQLIVVPILMNTLWRLKLVEKKS